MMSSVPGKIAPRLVVMSWAPSSENSRYSLVNFVEATDAALDYSIVTNSNVPELEKGVATEETCQH